MRIVGIIPAYNEEKTIGIVIEKLTKYVDNIIVIDDGSEDNTAKIAERYKRTKVIRNIIRRGLGYTIRKGYKEALKAKADIIIQIDADNQYTIEDIPKLVEPILKNQADMVLASRFAGGIESMPFGKKIGNQIGTFVTKMISETKISDAQTGFRAIRKELLQEIEPRNKYTYTQEMIIKAAYAGWRIKEIPSYFKKRTDGKSRLLNSTFSYLSKAVIIILRSVTEHHPLLFFSVFSFFSFLCGIISLFIFKSEILTIIFCTSSVFIMFLGIISDMIKMKNEQIIERIKDLENKES